VTCVFFAKLAVQVPGQVIPAGLLLTVPEFVAGAATVNWYCDDPPPPELLPDPQPARSRLTAIDEMRHNFFIVNMARQLPRAK